LRLLVGAETCRGTSRGWKGSDDKRDLMSWSAAWTSSLAPRYQDSDRRWTSSGDRHAPRPPQGRGQMPIWREAREQSAFSLPVSCNRMSEDAWARNRACEPPSSSILKRLKSSKCGNWHAFMRRIGAGQPADGRHCVRRNTPANIAILFADDDFVQLQRIAPEVPACEC
jgi:hypothetical protein